MKFHRHTIVVGIGRMILHRNGIHRHIFFVAQHIHRKLATFHEFFNQTLFIERCSRSLCDGSLQKFVVRGYFQNSDTTRTCGHIRFDNQLFLGIQSPYFIPKRRFISLGVTIENACLLPSLPHARLSQDGIESFGHQRTIVTTMYGIHRRHRQIDTSKCTINIVSCFFERLQNACRILHIHLPMFIATHGRTSIPVDNKNFIAEELQSLADSSAKHISS